MTKQFSPTDEAYDPLQVAFDHYNLVLMEGCLGRRLEPVIFTYQRKKSTYGYYSYKRFTSAEGVCRDEIAINPEYFAVVPLIECLQTLVHEMVHAYQQHFGKPSRSGYHNHEFARFMQAVGLMPSGTGRPGGPLVGQAMADYPVPGGAFERATRELLTRGFKITWLDRFPPNETLHMPVRHGSEVAPAIAADPAIAAALLAPATQGTALELATSARNANRSNRHKYSCGGCRLSVWGKPGLRISCTDCSLELEEDEPDTSGPVNVAPHAGRTALTGDMPA
ncbi:sprT domain-containing protein [Pandoraea cepalis]|uniref:SprT domain-containing protein n=1 Tax=Pandoraea cepalis TaxID=2508294 RepID=A0AAW7MGZ2_9BURK|nr:SprT-like domain-containing protein [Pandoraea cepalis]MDN4572023.1 sprT domain-containing protein [Pandoraea cepalis]MDN4576674.1 sprT domain-containing protein [Pandoraea cepalis]